MSKITLYTYFRSSCAYRVRIGLNLKNIVYDSSAVHLLKNGGEQNSQAFKKINPLAQVPSLQVDSIIFSQSIAILEYLEEKYPQPSLLPKNLDERAYVRQMCEVINSGLQPLQGLAVTQYLEKTLRLNTEEKQKWLNHWISKGLDSFETLLRTHSADYCFGNTLTMADCCLIPQIFSAERFNVDLTPFPISRKIYNKCLTLDAFIKASPSHQPDFEP